MKKTVLLVCGLALVLLFKMPTGAAVIPLTDAFATGLGIGDYGNVTLTEVGGKVQFDIILDTSSLGSDADIFLVYFNTVDQKVGLNIASSTPSGSLSYSFNNSDEFYKADGDGYFDGVVDFGSGTPWYNSASFSLGADSHLNIDDFLVGSVGGEKGSFQLAIHVQSTATTSGSEFIGGNAVPIPGAVWLLGSGIICIAGVRRKYRGRSNLHDSK